MTNATVIKINDSSLPQDMVKNFREMLFAQFLPEDAKIFLCRLVECSVRFLSKYKSKDAHVTVKYTTLNTDKTFLFGLAADYIPPEGDAEENPGTWTVSACMNQEFLTSENAQSNIEYDLLTTSFCNEMIQLLGKYANLQLVDPKEFARITTELNNLKQANENYDELERLKKIATDYAETRDAVIADELLAIESTVNQQMREISLTILSDATHLPPVLRLEKLNKYTFYTPNDGGTGAQYRGLITFDLANMGVAPVPFVVHDSVLLKNIERPVFSAIIRVYYDQKQKGKQVFMAYDTLDAYDKETRELVEENAVLQLSPGGNELFGWAWNKEEQHEAKQE